MTAPIKVPIPCVVPMEIATERNVKLKPITIGRREPIFQIGYSWISVPILAMIMQF